MRVFYTLGSVSRARLLAGAGLVAIFNALGQRISYSLAKGATASISETFGVSAIIWLAIAAIVALTLDAAGDEGGRLRARQADLWVSGLAVLLSLTPAPVAAAAVLVPLSGWMVLTAGPNTLLRRTGIICLVLTLTLFWGPLALRVMPELLWADAHAVAWVLGGEVDGNIFTSVDGSWRFLVAPGCSSLSNMSLATILAVTLSQYLRIAMDRWVLGAVALASLATIAVNVARMAMIARHPLQFSYWHHGTGATMFGWLCLIVICAIVGVTIDQRVTNAQR